MGDTVVYDKAKWQMTGASGSAPSWEHASGSALYFLRWLIERHLMAESFAEDTKPFFEEYKAGKISLFQFYESGCDQCLLSDMLSEEGNAFARDYFEYDHGYYVKDLWAHLGLGKSDFPLFNEEEYQRFKPVIEKRYVSWKTGEIGSTRVPAKKPKPQWLVVFRATLILMGLLIILFGIMWLLSWLVNL